MVFYAFTEKKEKSLNLVIQSRGKKLFELFPGPTFYTFLWRNVEVCIVAGFLSFGSLHSATNVNFD